MKVNKKKCKACGERFTPSFSTLQVACSVKCSIEYAKKNRPKEAKKEWAIKKKEIKDKIMSKADYMKMLEKVFNTYIRIRDKNLPCISCGVYKAEEFHSGHFMAKTYSFLRFNEDNVWKQCSKCNTHLRGNLIPYRIELINRIGLERVEWLENSRHIASDISIPKIKEMISEYRKKIKDANND